MLPPISAQVLGIDEADLVKNDGRFIYSVGGTQLVVVQAFPLDDRRVLSRTSFAAQLPAGASYPVVAAEEALLLSGQNRLLVILTAQVTSDGFAQLRGCAGADVGRGRRLQPQTAQDAHI
jgi:hypothetical protein